MYTLSTVDVLPTYFGLYRHHHSSQDGPRRLTTCCLFPYAVLTSPIFTMFNAHWGFHNASTCIPNATVTLNRSIANPSPSHSHVVGAGRSPLSTFAGVVDFVPVLNQCWTAEMALDPAVSNELVCTDHLTLYTIWT